MSEERREALLDAAEGLLSQIGYRKMTMEDVARAAGLTRRTVYAYFPAKEQVALAVLDRGIDRLIAELEQIAGGGGSALERVERILLCRVLRLHERARERRHSFSEALGSLRDEWAQRRERHMAREADLLAGLLREAGVEDPSETAHALILATSGFMPANCPPSLAASPARLEATLRVAVGLMSAGVRNAK